MNIVFVNATCIIRLIILSRAMQFIGIPLICVLHRIYTKTMLTSNTINNMTTHLMQD